MSAVEQIERVERTAPHRSSDGTLLYHQCLECGYKPANLPFCFNCGVDFGWTNDGRVSEFAMWRMLASIAQDGGASHSGSDMHSMTEEIFAIRGYGPLTVEPTYIAGRAKPSAFYERCPCGYRPLSIAPTPCPNCGQDHAWLSDGRVARAHLEFMLDDGRHPGAEIKAMIEEILQAREAE